jgi:hypothetical protein
MSSSHDGAPPTQSSSDNRIHELLDVTLKKLTAAFGPPRRSEPLIAQWSLPRPEPLCEITVLVPPPREQPPTVWVFDPHDRVNNIHAEVITDPQAIDRLADMVTRKINGAPRR